MYFDMYTHIYIYIHVHIFVYMYTDTHTYMYMYLYTYVCLYTYSCGLSACAHSWYLLVRLRARACCIMQVGKRGAARSTIHSVKSLFRLTYTWFKSTASYHMQPISFMQMHHVKTGRVTDGKTGRGSHCFL